MKHKIKKFLIYTSLTLFTILIFESCLGLIFNHYDLKRNTNETAFKINSGAYDNVDSEIVKEIFSELYTIDSQWEPFVHFKLKESNLKHHTINSNGVRKTKNFGNSNNNDTLKIFCFGGSTMFSTGARDNKTIPSEISKLLHEKFPEKNIEITNFGCHAYNRSIENIQLQQQLLKNNIPNIVIFYDGVNEIISAHRNNKAGIPTIAPIKSVEKKYGRGYLNKIHQLYKTSYTNRLVKKIQSKIIKTDSNYTSNNTKLPHDIANNYISNLKLSKSLSRTYKFKVINFLQPVIYTKKPLTKSEQIMASKTTYYKQLYLDSYKLIQEDKTLKDNNTFINISNAFNKTKRTIYTDFCHTGEYGNKLIANEIFKHLRNKLTTSDSINQIIP